MNTLYKIAIAVLVVASISVYSNCSFAAGCPKGKPVLNHIKEEINRLSAAHKFNDFHPNYHMVKPTITLSDTNFLGPTIVYEVYWNTQSNIVQADFLHLDRDIVQIMPGNKVQKMYEWDQTTQQYQCPYQVMTKNHFDGYVYLLNGKEKPGWSFWDWFSGE